MPPLHGAIALEQVHERAVQVAEDLDFDVARAAQEPFRVHLVLAEGAVRLAPRRLDERRQLRRPTPRPAARDRRRPGWP